MQSNIEFKWSSDRWATARTNNVEKLYELWAKEPNRAEVLDDPKLRDGQLVIIKKEYLDLLLESYKQSENRSAQASILFQTIDLVTALAPKKENDGLDKAISLLASLKENLKLKTV